MMISVADFLRAANERGKDGGATAFIVDFSGVQNIDDPTIERSLFEHFRRTASDVTDQIARLARHEVACLSGADAAKALTSAVDELDDVVRDLGLGAVRCDLYALPRDGRALAERVRAIIGSYEAGNLAAQRNTRRNDLAQLLKTEQMMRRADISPLIHHQAIYDFAKPRNPVTLARELTVSIARLADALGIQVAENTWLFDKITLLLDRRMLFHLIQDRSRHAEPFAINLRVATVLSPDFSELIGRLAAGDHETLIVELPKADHAADPDAFDAAVDELERLGVHSAYHAGGWDDLRSMIEGEDAKVLREIDFLKVRWDSTDLDLTAGEIGKLKSIVDQVGPHRLVFERAESEAAIDFALGIGVRLMQGFGVTDHVQDIQVKARDRVAAKVRRTARKGNEPADEPKKDSGGGALRKMFKL